MWRCIIRARDPKTTGMYHFWYKKCEFDHSHTPLVEIKNGTTPTKGIWQQVPKLQVHLSNLTCGNLSYRYTCGHTKMTNVHTGHSFK